MSSIDLSKFETKAPQNKVPTDKPSESLAEKLTTILNVDIAIFDKKFGQNQKEAFYSELGLLL